MNSSFDARKVLSGLKPFQRTTADYVWDRFEKHGASRFLVADEVGLGKTIVAKGVIARLIEADQGNETFSKSKPKDIVYICSNETIARQNLRKLNLLDEKGADKQTIASRLTLLPFDKRMSDLDSGWRFLSFTPGTTFHSGRNSGQALERALIWHLLKGSGLHSGTKDALLRGKVSQENFENWYKSSAAKSLATLKKVENRDAVHREFLAQIKSETSSPTSNDQSLLCEMRRVGLEYKAHSGNADEDKRQLVAHQRNLIVGRLREILSRIALKSINPRLIIFDEFQRFADLFDTENDADQSSGGAALMRSLLEQNGTLCLFLSATPYRMLSVRGDKVEGEEHHQALLRTIAHLYGQSEDGSVAKELKTEFRAYRSFLHKLPELEAKQGAIERKHKIEGHLRPVMSRTERANNTTDRNSMVKDCVIPAPVALEDLIDLVALTKLGEAIGSRDLVEFWKSSPYLLDFMSGYQMNGQMEKFAKNNPDEWEKFKQALGNLRLDPKALNNFKPVEFRNGRLRALVCKTLDAKGNMARRLWLPPSLPYLEVDDDAKTLSKSLVFSEWNMVPEAVAALLSYEAERIMTGADRTRTEPVSHPYFEKDERVLLPLKTNVEVDQSGFSLIPLIYPSRFLAELIDPLAIRRAFSNAPSYEKLHARAVEILRNKLAGLVVDDLGGRRPQLWECVRYFNEQNLKDEERLSIAEAIRVDGEDSFEEGVATASKSDNALYTLIQKWHDTQSLGDNIRFDNKLLVDLADLALGSPAICAYRTFRRLDDAQEGEELELRKAKLQAAVSVARGFRTLFNRREVVGMLRPENSFGWVSVLKYCARHDLQAVLDEYVYVLQSEISSEGQERLQYLALHIRSAVSANASHISLREPGQKTSQRYQLRGHFAMRLAEHKGSDKAAQSGKFRADTVRDAFNSPFRPFVLVSTSIGQEGLDFHNYCYKLWHWNIPHSPIDLEQREGRVQRYMGHAVRQNIIQRFGHVALEGEGKQNPWPAILRVAEASFPGGNGLSPHWLMDGEVKVQRCVPLPPLSRDAEKFQNLIKSLAIYRLAFGQPRQEDLLKYLETISEENEMSGEDWEMMQVSLTPDASPV